jgi:hypothetical protein
MWTRVVDFTFRQALYQGKDPTEPIRWKAGSHGDRPGRDGEEKIRMWTPARPCIAPSLSLTAHYVGNINKQYGHFNTKSTSGVCGFACLGKQKLDRHLQNATLEETGFGNIRQQTLYISSKGVISGP